MHQKCKLIGTNLISHTWKRRRVFELKLNYSSIWIFQHPQISSICTHNKNHQSKSAIQDVEKGNCKNNNTIMISGFLLYFYMTLLRYMQFAKQQQQQFYSVLSSLIKMEFIKINHCKFYISYYYFRPTTSVLIHLSVK